MNSITKLLVSGCVLAGMVSCSSAPEFLGSWTSVTPEDLTDRMPSASMASTVVTMEFAEGMTKDGGTVAVTYDVDALRPMVTDSKSTVPSDVDLKAVVTVNGIWTYDVDDDDDLLIKFDMETMNISTDSNTSLTPEMAERWKHEVKRTVSADLSRFTVVDDVEVSHNGQVMSLEVHSPEAKLKFRKSDM